MSKPVRRQCPKCGEVKEFRADQKTCGCKVIRKTTEDAKILLLDIETMATLAWVWAAYDTNIIDVYQHEYILSFAYKFIGDEKVQVLGLDDFNEKTAFPAARNDKALLVKLREIISQADIIVAHNGQAFDMQKINGRLMVHQLPPLPPYRTFDTLLELRKNARFISNKLDHIADEMGIGRKLSHEGFGLWLGCAQGDPQAWKKMKAYNRHDVELLEELYYRLRPYSKKHPNVAHSLGRCRKCGSQNLKREGFVYTNFRRKPREYCFDCQGWQEGSVEKM